MGTIYQFWPGYADGANGLAVDHACGHNVRYSYGGTSPEFDGYRADFARRASERSCPDCAVIEAGREHGVPRIHLPAYATDGVGPGVLTTELTGAWGSLVFAANETVLVERFDEDARPAGARYSYTRYLYATRLFGPRSYLHEREGVTYSDEQRRWVDDYVVQSTLDRTPGSHDRYYHFGASFKTAEQWARIQASGVAVPLASVRLPDGRIVGEDLGMVPDEAARSEAALELACEDGRISGAN